MIRWGTPTEKRKLKWKNLGLSTISEMIFHWMHLIAVWIWEKRTGEPEDTSIILSNLKKSTKKITRGASVTMGNYQAI